MAKVLINTPNYKDPSSGGIASYYYGMLGYWNEDVRYNVIGRRKGLSGAFWLPLDIVKFAFIILFWQPDAVLINPSLFMNAMRRDFTFLRVAKFLGKPVVVLIHGFDLGVAENIDHNWVKRNLNKASLVMVLANLFRKTLENWGVVTPIELITTKVEDRMLDGFDIKCRDGVVSNILFLSRMIKEKGVYETIKTYMILKGKYPKLQLTMVGGGPELENLKTYVEKNRVKDVVFTGPLSGDERLKAYRESNFFFFLSSYGEGMPTVVLEAMAFGMPVMTRKVGGLADFFEDEKMGRITESLEPEVFAKMVEPYIIDEEMTKRVSKYNHQYALAHFMATTVGKRIESLIMKYTVTC